MSRRPVDAARVRTVGTNMQALARSHLRIVEDLNECYRQLGEELEHADPGTEEGKDLQRLFLEANRVFTRVACCHQFIQVGEDIRGFGIERECSTSPVVAAGHALVEASPS